MWFYTGLGHAQEAPCSPQAAEALWQTTHSRLHTLFGISVAQPQIVVYPGRGDLSVGDEPSTFGYYDRASQTLHVACQKHNADLLAVAVRHEATHHYLAQAFGRIPLWLDEGLASYMENEGGPQGLDGLHNVNTPRLREFVAMLKRSTVPTLRQLLTHNPFAHHASQYYAAYWALVFALMHHPDAATQQQRRVLLMDLLNESRHDDPAAVNKRLIEGLLKASNTSLADWELRWRQQIWALRP
jgi:hypothetical protein